MGRGGAVRAGAVTGAVATAGVGEECGCRGVCITGRRCGRAAAWRMGGGGAGGGGNGNAGSGRSAAASGGGGGGTGNASGAGGGGGGATATGAGWGGVGGGGVAATGGAGGGSAGLGGGGFGAAGCAAGGGAGFGATNAMAKSDAGTGSGGRGGHVVNQINPASTARCASTAEASRGSGGRGNAPQSGVRRSVAPSCRSGLRLPASRPQWWDAVCAGRSGPVRGTAAAGSTRQNRAWVSGVPSCWPSPNAPASWPQRQRGRIAGRFRRTEMTDSPKTPRHLPSVEDERRTRRAPRFLCVRRGNQQPELSMPCGWLEAAAASPSRHGPACQGSYQDKNWLQSNCIIQGTHAHTASCWLPSPPPLPRRHCALPCVRTSTCSIRRIPPPVSAASCSPGCAASCSTSTRT